MDGAAGRPNPDGDYERSLNPGLARLLRVLDEAEEKLRQGDLAENC